MQFLGRQVPHLDAGVDIGARPGPLPDHPVLVLDQPDRKAVGVELGVRLAIVQPEQPHECRKRTLPLGIVVSEIVDEALHIRATAQPVIGEMLEPW